MSLMMLVFVSALYNPCGSGCSRSGTFFRWSLIPENTFLNSIITNHKKTYVSERMADNPINNIEDDIYGCATIQNPNECNEKLECEAVFTQNGLNKDQVGMPVLNKEFERCQAFPKEIIKENHVKYTLCVNTKGSWLASIKTCSCGMEINPNTGQQMGKTFHDLLGCMFDQDICVAQGGIWNLEGYPYDNNIKYTNYCTINGEKVKL